MYKLPSQAETSTQALCTRLGGTYRVLVMVNTLCQHRAERHWRQSPWLLPHSPDLQQGTEG